MSKDLIQKIPGCDSVKIEKTSANDMRTESNCRLCDGFDCEMESQTSIEVTAGKYGTVMLSLCKQCVSKFQEDEKKYQI